MRGVSLRERLIIIRMTESILNFWKVAVMYGRALDHGSGFAVHVMKCWIDSLCILQHRHTLFGHGLNGSP